ncbi:MAG: hypothetical protein AUJ72_01425 [Candidatus Omnitrophica bacterium CG1_02_46_14]|nr:MAG: hypothetical protein AUJ72_01425 [Candidatus Omnitrophica bacterium CG1_02_46_14]
MPFTFKKIYYFASVASLGFIGWAIGHFGETNLPPLILTVRYIILALYANWFLSYIILVSDRKIENEKPAGWIWLAFAGLFLSLMHPVFSGDLMEYLIRGRMLAIYHKSPYQFVPNDFPDDILRPFSIWVTNPDSYGPISVYLQTLPVLIFPTSIVWMIWAYKIMVLIFFGIAVMFFWKITQNLKLPNPIQLWAMFAYCPLIIVAAFIDGHNDVIMMALSLASLYFLIKNQYDRAFLFWTFGFLVKYMVVIQLPFMVVYAVKKQWNSRKAFPLAFIIKQVLINTAVIVICFAPVWGGEKTFLAILRQKGSFYTNTIPYVFFLVPKFFGWVIDQQLLKTFFIGLFLIFYSYLLRWCWKKHQTISEDFFKIVSLGYLAFYAALPSPMGYWYLLWAIFWIVLACWPKSILLVTLYSAVGLFSFFKRINFLSIAAAFIYGACLIWSRFFSKSGIK